MSFTPPPSYINGCPNYSGPTFNPDSTALEMIWIVCIETKCKWWDSTANTCSAEVIQSVRNTNNNIYNTNNNIYQLMDNMQQLMNNMHDLIDGMYKLDSHNHYSHSHEQPHVSADVNTINGAALTKAVASASSLITEKQGNEDIDGNGYVYGKDFYIDPDDPEIPEMVSKIPVENESVPLISWADYMDSTSPFSIG